MHKGYKHTEETKKKISNSQRIIHKNYNLANHIEELIVEDECSDSEELLYTDWVYDVYRPARERYDYWINVIPK